jgi:hypothetical protein
MNGTADIRDTKWPAQPIVFPDLMTLVEAAIFVRLDQTEHNSRRACRTLD